MSNSQNVYFPALTGFRALAAFLVFFHHANPFSVKASKFAYLFVNEFYIGVSMFFVLSGFLICLRYENLIITKDSFIPYLQNRFARIYPLYFLLTTLTFIIFIKNNKLVSNNETLFIYLANITFLKGFFNDLKFTGIGQGWSLTVEECFYFLAPFILLWWKKFKLLMPILFLSIGSLLVLLFNHTNFYGLFHDFHFMMEYTFFGRCFEFFVGVGLAHWIKKNTCQISFPWTYAGLAVIILVTGVLSFIGTKGGFGIGQPIGIVLNNFILPFAIAALIYGLVIEKTWIQKIFSFRLIELLGKSSYAFYLIHAGIFFSAIHHYLTQNVFLIFLLLIILSIALYYLIEKPLNERWKSKKLINE